MSKPWTLDPDRLFDPNPARRGVARSLYEEVADLPLVGPHGHVPPVLLADPDATLGTPADLFIIPGHRYRMVDALITNFHLPRSSLLMLVSAFAGRELVLKAYSEAMRLDYRFYSFGDAMLIA